MHQAQQFILASVLPAHPGIIPTAIALDSSFASGIEQRLKSDAIGYCFSGTVSVADAITAIDVGLFTWSTVKLYYAAFYLARALLGIKAVSIFHLGRTPYRWVAGVGQVPSKMRGNTHAVVLDEFAAQGHFPAFLSQQIAGMSPLVWLRERRVEANYGNARFSEPDAPPHLSQISQIGARRALDAYVSDETNLYAFDADHAMLALPIELLKHVVFELDRLPVVYSLSKPDRAYLVSLFKDAKGPIAAMKRLLHG